jgi:hypothetical protein
MESHEAGLQRVLAKEGNNRNMATAKSEGVKTPRKSGAQRGFASNKISKPGRIAGKAS